MTTNRNNLKVSLRGKTTPLGFEHGDIIDLSGIATIVDGVYAIVIDPQHAETEIVFLTGPNRGRRVWMNNDNTVYPCVQFDVEETS